MAATAFNEEENKKLSAIARRSGLRLTLYSVLISLLPLGLFFAAGSLSHEQLNGLAVLIALLGLVLQMTSHLIIARLRLFKWLLLEKYKPHMVTKVPTKELKPYFWGWYLRFLGIFIATVAGFGVISYYMEKSAPHSSSSGVIAIIIFLTINRVTIINLLQRLVRDGKVSF